MQTSVTGSVGLENALDQNKAQAMYDEAGKKLLMYKEVLATILKYSVPKYAQYSAEEIISFIDVDSISEETAVAPDTDTRIQGDNTVQSSIREANLTFDVAFRVIKPETKNIHIHVDVELQGNYYPGYAIEKRGICNLARLVSSQVDVINRQTNYDKLEKSYCIFICVGNVPQYMQNTVSYYGFTNTQNVGTRTSQFRTRPEDYDLMGLVIIRIGNHVNRNAAEIIKFLHALFYVTPDLDEYVDFTQNTAYRKELEKMSITGEHLIQYGQEMEREKAEKELREERKKLEQERSEKKAALKYAAELEEELARLKAQMLQ